MSPQTQALLDAALALPEAGRALLVEGLLESLSEEGDDRTDEELVAELDQRRAEMADGTDPGIPASDLWLDK
jgi:putative addiction module component (TIGR02574 family)